MMMILKAGCKVCDYFIFFIFFQFRYFGTVVIISLFFKIIYRY